MNGRNCIFECVSPVRLLLSPSNATHRGSELIGNAANAGGAIHVGAGCTLNVNNTVNFYDNTATQPSSGGAIYLGSGASMTVDRCVCEVHLCVHPR